MLASGSCASLFPNTSAIKSGNTYASPEGDMLSGLQGRPVCWEWTLVQGLALCACCRLKELPWPVPLWSSCHLIVESKLKVMLLEIVYWSSWKLVICILSFWQRGELVRNMVQVGAECEETKGTALSPKTHAFCPRMPTDLILFFFQFTFWYPFSPLSWLYLFAAEMACCTRS